MANQRSILIKSYEKMQAAFNNLSDDSKALLERADNLNTIYDTFLKHSMPANIDSLLSLFSLSAQSVAYFKKRNELINSKVPVNKKFTLEKTELNSHIALHKEDYKQLEISKNKCDELYNQFVNGNNVDFDSLNSMLEKTTTAFLQRKETYQKLNERATRNIIKYQTIFQSLSSMDKDIKDLTIEVLYQHTVKTNQALINLYNKLNETLSKLEKVFITFTSLSKDKDKYQNYLSSLKGQLNILNLENKTIQTMLVEIYQLHNIYKHPTNEQQISQDTFEKLLKEGIQFFAKLTLEYMGEHSKKLKTLSDESKRLKKLEQISSASVNTSGTLFNNQKTLSEDEKASETNTQEIVRAVPDSTNNQFNPNQSSASTQDSANSQPKPY